MESIHDFSIRMAGARDMLIKMRGAFPTMAKGKQRMFHPDRVVDETIYQFLISDQRNLEKYLVDEADLWGKPVEFDKKGKAVKYEMQWK